MSTNDNTNTSNDASKPTLKEELMTARDDARRDGDTRTLRVVQAMLTTLANTETSGKTRIELTEEASIVALRKLAAGYRDAARQFTAGGRDERAQEEQRDAEIIDDFLPEILDEQATEAIVEQIVAEENLIPPFDPSMRGRVMKKINTRPDVATIDKKLAASLVQGAVEARHVEFQG